MQTIKGNLQYNKDFVAEPVISTYAFQTVLHLLLSAEAFSEFASCNAQLVFVIKQFLYARLLFYKIMTPK
jgi:hypothetical protein